jgi:hypothetical protein
MRLAKTCKDFIRGKSHKPCSRFRLITRVGSDGFRLRVYRLRVYMLRSSTTISTTAIRPSRNFPCCRPCLCTDALDEESPGTDAALYQGRGHCRSSRAHGLLLKPVSWAAASPKYPLFLKTRRTSLPIHRLKLEYSKSYPKKPWYSGVSTRVRGHFLAACRSFLGKPPQPSMAFVSANRRHRDTLWITFTTMRLYCGLHRIFFRCQPRFLRLPFSLLLLHVETALAPVSFQTEPHEA